MIDAIRRQLHRLLPTALAIYVPCWIVLAAILIACVKFNLQFGDFSRDQLAVCRDAGDVKYYYGALSNLGALVWCSAASISCFAAILLNRSNDTAGFWFFGSLGGLSSMLLVDDFFLLHERVVPELLGVSEDVVIGSHLLVAGFVVLCNIRAIAESDYLLLFIAFLLFAVSVLQDQFAVIPPQMTFQGEPHVVEDGCKFLAICTWCGYIAHSAFYRTIRLDQTEQR